ncbi:MAG: hypothetical protein IPP80_14495 [Ignavibacteria bacterium]|nr:hypothetical protein [Ignavibacteria bacterium]
MGQTVFIGMKTFQPGMNELEALTRVGNYGVQASWRTDVTPGIYTHKDDPAYSGSSSESRDPCPGSISK